MRKSLFVLLMKGVGLIVLIYVLITFLTSYDFKGIFEAYIPEKEESSEEVDDSPTYLDITFIDVGQGDATLVECDGKYMLVDGGMPEYSDTIYSILQKKDIHYLDVIVATHDHADHVGGLSGALEYVNVGTVYSSVDSSDNTSFQMFKEEVEAKGKEITVVKAGYSFMLGRATVDVLGPVNDSDEPNNMSLVLKISLGDASVLIMGDAERDEIQDILNFGADVSADVIRISHHGSGNGTTYPLLYEVNPTYAIISCGKDNDYGHPMDSVLSKLQNAEITLFRTDLQGDISMYYDGETITIVPDHGKTVDVWVPGDSLE